MKKNLPFSTDVFISIFSGLSILFIIGLLISNYQSNLFEKPVVFGSELKIKNSSNEKARKNLVALNKKYQRTKDIAKIETSRAKISNTDQWQNYTNKWYGYQIKYPKNYNKPKILKSNPSAFNYEKIYRFEKNSQNNNSSFQGFDITIYNKKTSKDIASTDQIISKSQKAKNQDFLVNNIVALSAKNDNYKFYEVNVSKNNDCFEPNYFFSFDRGNYIYNVSAILKKGHSYQASPKKQLIDEMPEIFQIASSLEFIKIVRPKPKPKAPKPHGAKKVNGKYVCAKKNDKPSVSKKNPKGHMDMQCCLDPDEVPNPWCTY
ncbi:MAG: hypothetical protein GF335_02260 [Candidatus Moranbacteria bacterium]|nr:hypothetical protein [Candidatus Moranbacteria bacterium]